MLDLQFIRDNPDLVAEKTKQKGYDVDIHRLLELDGKRREVLTRTDDLRRQRNEQAAELKNGRPTDEQIAAGKRIKESITTAEQELGVIDDELEPLIKSVPNMPHDDVPVGASEAENVVAYEWGEKPHFDFEPKNHWEIAEARGLIDKERAAKVAGSRFAYIKGSLVELQFAIMQYVITTLGSETILQQLIHENDLHISPRPFIPILPPAMIKTEVFEAMDRLEPRDDRYRVGEESDDLWLQGSAEHTLGSMYMDEILPAEQLPIRYVGYSSSFRREAGTYGKDSEGIIRMHQFDKLEMEVFSDAASGLDEHKLMVALQEYMMRSLGLPYRLIQKCTYDIGKPNARGIDIEVWLPGQGQYRETHTADYMTDYQARRLKTRARNADGSVQLVHTNDATAFALGRIIVAIIENYQQADGSVIVPTALRPYIGNKEVI